MVEKQTQADYQKKYEKKRLLKHVSFNTETEQELLNFVKSVEFSQWVKQKIREELNHK